MKAYHKYYPVSAPEEDHDDRNALYSMSVLAQTGVKEDFTDRSFTMVDASTSTLHRHTHPRSASDESMLIPLHSDLADREKCHGNHAVLGGQVPGRV